MKQVTSRGVIVLVAALGMLLVEPAISLAGPSIMAVTNYGEKPRRLAKVRASHNAELGRGTEVVASFDHPDYDFGHVVVRSSQPLSVVRRNLRVAYVSAGLVVDTRGGETGEAVKADEMEIWLRVDGRILPGHTYEWEVTGRPEKPIKGGTEVALPLIWADGRQIASHTTVRDPNSKEAQEEKDKEKEEEPEDDDPNPVDDVGHMRFPSINGLVTMPDFKRQTGGAWVVFKLKDFGAWFLIQRFSLREIDDERSGRTDNAMPIPTAYVPCRDRVEDLVAMALSEGEATLKRIQDPRGPWPVGGSIEEVVYWSARICKVIAEMEGRSGRVRRAMDWIAEQAPPEGMAWQTRTVAARLECLARHGGLKKYRKVIYSDVDTLTASQLNDGGWLGATDMRARVINRADNTESFDVLMALREAAIAGAPVERNVWRDALSYWMEAQAEDGGYHTRIEKYGGVGMPPSMAQTAAGAAALIALSDMNTGFGGRGCVKQVAGRRHGEAISDAIAWLNRHYDPKAAQGLGAIAYLGFNDDPFLEADRMRAVGEISGLKEFNGYNHFLESAKKLTENYAKGAGQFGLRGREGLNLHRTAWALDILGAGNAPTVCQRIVVGAAEDDTARFKCDVPHLVRYMSQARRRQFNWCHVTIDTEIQELVRVPIMFLNFVGPSDWTEDQWNKLRLYVYSGGTIVVNIDDAFEGDRQEVIDRLAQVFPEYEFRTLPNDDLVFQPNKLDEEDDDESDDEEDEAEDGESEDDKVAEDDEEGDEEEEDSGPERPGLIAMGNGFREFLFVAEDNWSCQWHLYETKEHRATFDFMNTLLSYATDGTPPRDSFAPSTYSADTVPMQRLRAMTIEVGGARPAYPGLTFYMDRLLKYEYRLAVDAVEDMADADVIWISVTGDTYSDEDKAELREAIQSGAFVFIDIVSGNESWHEDFQAALIDAVEGVSLERSRRTHPVYTGEVPGTRGLNAVDVRFRKSLQSRFNKRGRCDLYDIVYGGKPVGVFSAHDVTSGIGYHFFPGCRGVLPGDARKITMNVLLLSYAQHLGLDIWK